VANRKRARLLSATALVSASLLGAAMPASAASRCPAGQSCVAVIVGGSVVDTFTTSQIEAGDIQNDPVYQVRQPHGTTCSDSDPIAAGSSIYSLLNQAAVSLAAGGHVEVSSPGVASMDLTARQLSVDGGGQFYEGQIPVVYGNGASSSLAFIRGLLADPAPCPPTGPKPGADSNAGAQGDYFGVSEIDLTVYGGPTVDVALTPSPTTTATGRDVAFTANVAGGDGATYTYHWVFGDGGAATTTVDHVAYPYDIQGTYVAQVSVDGSDGSTGVSPPDTVTVGGKQTTGGSTPKGSGTAPSPGPSTGPTKGSGHRGGAPAAGGNAGVDTTASHNAGTGSTHLQMPHPRRRSRPGRVSAAVGTEVTGQLLGTPRHLVAVSESDSTPLLIGSAPAAAAPSGESPLALSCGIAVAALLVAAGAARELRSRRR
jgi:PKD domain